MRDVRYLRAQAELCLELAHQISDRKAAENLKAEAARYQAEAIGLETGKLDVKQASGALATQGGND